MQDDLGPRLRKLREKLRALPLSQEGDEVVDAVVGVLLLEESGRDIETLLIQRPERPNDPWSGQVGFPGGRIEKSDATVKDAVRREVEEEVGIHLSTDGQEIGRLSIGRPGRNPTVSVQPWVHALKRRPSIKTNAEVVEAFWVSLPDLSRKLSKAEVEIRGERRVVDCYLVDRHIVWGFTFRVLGELMQIPEVMSRS